MILEIFKIFRKKWQGSWIFGKAGAEIRKNKTNHYLRNKVFILPYCLLFFVISEPPPLGVDQSFVFSKIGKNYDFVISSIQDFENRIVMYTFTQYILYKGLFIHSDRSSHYLCWLFVLRKHKHANRGNEPLPVLEAMLDTFGVRRF